MGQTVASSLGISMIQLSPCQHAIIDLNCPTDGKAQANTLGWFSFLLFFF